MYFPYRVGRELTREATNWGANVVSIGLSETQFETFQEISDFDFCRGSVGRGSSLGASSRKLKIAMLRVADSVREGSRISRDRKKGSLRMRSFHWRTL